MRGQGMKYAHAISDGRQGVEGDLEKSKRQIKRYKETVSKLLKNMTPHQKNLRGHARFRIPEKLVQGWS